MSSKRCEGYTSNGTRCKRLVPLGQQYCFQHAKLSGTQKTKTVKKASPPKEKLIPKSAKKKTSQKKGRGRKELVKQKRKSTSVARERSPATRLRQLPKNIIQFMIANIDLDEIPDFCRTNKDIELACQDEYTIEEYLKRLGLEDRMTRLVLAGLFDNRSIVETATSEEKQVIFVRAAEAGNLELVTELYDSVILIMNLTPRMYIVQKAIRVAAKKNRIEVVNYLVQKLNPTDFYTLKVIINIGATEIFIELAKYKGIKDLLSNKMRDSIGELYNSAILAGNVKIIRILKTIYFPNTREDIADYVRTIRSGTGIANLDVIKELLINRSIIDDPSTHSSEGWLSYYVTLFYYACYFGDEELYDIVEPIIRKSYMRIINDGLALAAVSGNKTIYNKLLDKAINKASQRKKYKEYYDRGYRSVFQITLTDLYQSKDLAIMFGDVRIMLFYQESYKKRYGTVDIYGLEDATITLIREKRYEELFIYIEELDPIGRGEVFDIIMEQLEDTDDIALIQSLEQKFPALMDYDAIMLHGQHQLKFVQYAFSKGATFPSKLTYDISIFSLIFLVKQGYIIPEKTIKEYRLFFDPATALYLKSHLSV